LAGKTFNLTSPQIKPKLNISLATTKVKYFAIIQGVSASSACNLDHAHFLKYAQQQLTQIQET